MNKTVTINISGIIFHIEEEAYEKLNKYLTTIKSYFSNVDGGSEIMSDIEARIAEMLQAKINATKQVVLMADVDYVINNMGKPEEFAENSSENNTNYNKEDSSYNEPIKKRLFRDEDNKVLGGVCAGIGHYFGFDVVWLRIALLILFFFYGSGFLLYIIFWIAVPKARTMSEKLSMKGEPVDINSISKAVKEEAEQLKQRMEKYGAEFKNRTANNRYIPRNWFEKFLDFLTDVLTNIGRVILKIIGVLMVIFGIIFFLGLSSSIFGMSFISTDIEGKEWIDLLLLDGNDFYLGLIGLTLFVGIPVIMMIFGGIKILFKLHYSTRWINLSAGIFWLFGFMVLLYVGIKTGNDFNKTAKIRQNINITPYETLYLKMVEVPVKSHEINVSDKEEEGEKNYNNYSKNNSYMVGNDNGLKYLLGHAQLNIIKSQTNKIDLVIVKEAKGSNKAVATERAKNISYHVLQTDSVIEFDNIFRVNNADKFRVQDLTIILKLPVGKIIYLDKSLEDFIYDIENISNTYDDDMINRRWIMTENGLKCLDCDGLELTSSDKEEKENSKQDVEVNINGVNINTKNAKLKTDSNGINIKSKEVQLTIDEKGIHIDTKKKK